MKRVLLHIREVVFLVMNCGMKHTSDVGVTIAVTVDNTWQTLPFESLYGVWNDREIIVNRIHINTTAFWKVGDTVSVRF